MAAMCFFKTLEISSTNTVHNEASKARVSLQDLHGGCSHKISKSSQCDLPTPFIFELPADAVE
eukprot:CAMPEP_0180525548 /NCGR_PEP_ID=MMETSP1036_2-20121128/59222_1 /TAXON_ID=632150 /ORGANISM="Azadinium spinosum, Strain 3D9" /LENGTH=62 /DNA_ID=CAMNT_0022538845 /DNA_START=367 /DNA_END=555 /DNA_ORIENTATION=+